MFKSPIAISLSPNTQLDDIWQAVKTLVQPWNWKKGCAVEKIEQWFKDYFEATHAVSFNSGRSALYAVLKSFDIGEGDEVLLQAFTCVAVPDPIIWIGAKPIYVDIDETLNIDFGALEKYINKKTKAIIVQHTFGVPAKIEMIKKIAQKHDLILIEDCAHALGGSFKSKKLGTFGDAAFFSFGRDKVISSVFGGVAIINSKFKTGAPRTSSKLRDLQKKLPFPNYFWILQQLLHPIAFALILPLYNIAIGKLILVVLQKLRLLSKPVYLEEKNGEKPSVFPARYPNALARLLLCQLKKLEIYNKLRKEKALCYFDQLTDKKGLVLPTQIEGALYLRFNLLTDKAEKILNIARERKMLLGNWYKNIIDPEGVDLEKLGYKKGSCPNAERMAKLSVNLPTYPKLSAEQLNAIACLFKEL